MIMFPLFATLISKAELYISHEEPSLEKEYYSIWNFSELGLMMHVSYCWFPNRATLCIFICHLLASGRAYLLYYLIFNMLAS
jgi:hypothetical protein